ncbi:MAG: GGDEF domain-containing protein [Oscillospiraceae bacterium]|nr:GGDEF domain-containing protein [Oscillospiraceae bacterium]
MENEERFIRSLTYADISRALSRDFFRIFCVNTLTDVFVEFDPDEKDESLDISMQGSDFRRVVMHLVEQVYSEDLDKVRTAFTKENLLRVLAVDDTFSLNYRMMLGGKATYVRLKATRVRREDPVHILIALSNTDAHMQRLAIYEHTMQSSLTYAGIAEALAADYFCIYYVCMDTGEFVEYKASEEYKKLAMPDCGDRFFSICQNEFINMVCEEDREAYLRAFDRENLLGVLSVNPSYALTYRIMLNGRPSYVRMKASRMAAEDDRHIVVGLSNVDESMRRNEEYRKMRVIAHKDPLTGVRSKHAYTVAEEHVNRLIAMGGQIPFSVAVCDVNGLKQINDTLGHKAGDRYIQDAARLICATFTHSPVYRIGGDEFVVLLRGGDYEARVALLEQLNRRIEANLGTEGVVVSVGMADYVYGKDTAMSCVFERADALMYRRKAQLKATRS